MPDDLADPSESSAIVRSGDSEALQIAEMPLQNGLLFREFIAAEPMLNAPAEVFTPQEKQAKGEDQSESVKKSIVNIVGKILDFADLTKTPVQIPDWVRKALGGADLIPKQAITQALESLGKLVDEAIKLTAAVAPPAKK